MAKAVWYVCLLAEIVIIYRFFSVLKGDGVAGSITFEQKTEDSPTIIEGEVRGLEEGLHGFHIHVYGDLSQGCTSTGT